MTSPDQRVTQYSYNAGGLLTSVTWPDGKIRSYHYEDSRFTWAMSGITDEAGVRFSTYSYNDQGRAINSEHTGGVGRVQFQYPIQNQTVVTSSDGSSRTYRFELIKNVLRPISLSAPCPECGDIAKSVAYDAAGNVASKRDFAEKEMRYSYDALGRETQRIEGYGTADAKTTTMEWHPTWSLPLKVAAPGRIDSFDYDPNGRVTSYAWYPTSDSNGSQGTSAAPAGSIARSVWVYNEQGLLATTVESIDGNATGQWAFTYDPLGNLSSVTTPGGKTGQALQYDSAGRILEAVDADGNHQKYEYNPRGQIVRYDVAGNTVTYEYNAMGFLTTVRGPEGSYIGYEYDSAHHLKAFLLQPAVTETVSTISPFSTAQTSANSGNVKNAGIWRRMWSWIKSWLGELVGDAHAQSSVQRIPVPQAPAQGAAGCNGTGCQQTLLDCLANCIRAYDPLSDEFKVALTGLGGTFPKAMVGLPRGLGGASRMTTVPSALAHGLGGGGARTVGGAARVVGRVVSPVWIGYGVYLAGMEGYCVANCAMNTCAH
ncbi:RHS repeat domain-containing protein [Cupriavidus basilensis]